MHTLKDLTSNYKNNIVFENNLIDYTEVKNDTFSQSDHYSGTDSIKKQQSETTLTFDNIHLNTNKNEHDLCEKMRSASSIERMKSSNAVKSNLFNSINTANGSIKTNSHGSK